MMEMLFSMILTLSQSFIFAYLVYMVFYYSAKHTGKSEKSRSGQSFNRTRNRKYQGPDFDVIDNMEEDYPLTSTIIAMKNVEPDFLVTEFISGVYNAYEMIVTGFEKGNLEEIRPFLSREVFDSFASAVTDREDRGLTIEAEFVGIRNITLIDAHFDANTDRAEITVCIVGELTSVIRGRGGDIIQGSPDTVNRQKNNWTFARLMGSNNPNWQLVKIEDNPRPWQVSETAVKN